MPIALRTLSVLVVASAAACGSGRGCEREREPAATGPEPAGAGSPARDAGRPGTCPRFGKPHLMGRVEAAGIVEASGLVASRKNAGVLWLHNDSGHSEQLYALSSSGRALATYSIGGATCVDWEDIATGTGPDGKWYLYIGDTGTNQHARSPVIVYRVEEPLVHADQSPVEATIENVETFELEYPDAQAHDSETLLIDPMTGDLYLVTKTNSGSSGVYRAAAPLLPGGRHKLAMVATLHTAIDAGRGSERTTAGDISADGRYIVIKTYTHAYLWIRADGATVAEALAGVPCEVPLAEEPQGEALGFSATGMGYFTVSEGSSQPIYFFERSE